MNKTNDQSYKFNSNHDIGSLDAESDKFLQEAFIQKSDYDILLDTNNSRCILCGRTGAGKSALISRLEHNENNLTRIIPESMSLKYLSNSTILNYFQKLNIKLDLFYKVLWKHVFIVELLKLKYGNDIDKSKSILNRLISNFKQKDKKKESAIEYLSNWQDEFWEKTEYRIKEIEMGLQKKFVQKLGLKGKLFESFFETGFENEDIEKESKNIEVIHKAQNVVNDIQIDEIFNILSLLREEIFIDDQKKFFIVIDDLDKEWVDKKIVYDILKGLIEAIKELKSLKGVKIIIALRENLLKKIFEDNSSRGVQREKYSNLYLNITWTDDELEQLLYNRINKLFSNQNSTNISSVHDILPKEKKQEKSGFHYILERTFLRPRDVIDFFNKCIKHAHGKIKINRETLHNAEYEYSNERLKAIEDEWLENYSNVKTLYSFLIGIKNGFKINDILEKADDYFFEKICTNSIEVEDTHLASIIDKYNKDTDIEHFLKSILLVLYEIGIICIKPTPEDQHKHCCKDSITFDLTNLDENVKIYIHPTFIKALQIKAR